MSRLEHLRSPPVFSEVRVTRSLVLYVCFVDRRLSFCTFSFGHCVACIAEILLTLALNTTILILTVKHLPDIDLFVFISVVVPQINL
jgi:hypothetical protein